MAAIQLHGSVAEFYSDKNKHALSDKNVRIFLIDFSEVCTTDMVDIL